MSYRKTPAQMFQEKQATIKERFKVKDLNIAYFNSLNAAISLFGYYSKEDPHKFIPKWRDYFLKEWRDWFLKTFPSELTKEEKEKGRERLVEIIKEEEEIKDANNKFQEAYEENLPF